MAKIKTATIVAGKFATGKDQFGKDQKGNFTGETQIGEKYFISKELMKSIGITKDADMKADFQFYAIISTTKIGIRDENGKIVAGVQTKREQAIKVFLDRRKMLMAKASSALDTIEEASIIRDAMEDANLTPERVKELTTAGSLI